LIGPLYFPTFLISIGTGMLIPILPLYLRENGLSYQLVTAVLAAAGLGALVSQVPIGAAISRIGEWKVVTGATLLLGAAIAALGFTSTTLALAALRFTGGLGNTGWTLSRQSFVSTSVAPQVRGRVSSTFGGVIRVAWLLGPLLGGFVAARFGFSAAFAVTGAVTAAGLLPLLTAEARATMPPPRPRRERPRLRDTVRRNRGPLVAVGAVQICVVAAREGRFAVIPLLGAALGLDVAKVGVLVAVGATSELVLFPLAGWLMDRYTRLAAIVPSLSLFALGLFVAAAATTPGMLMVGAAVTGLGNGIGAGTMLTMGADIAPRADASRFLSILGSVREAGRMFGPLAVGVVADRAGLAASAVVLGIVALVGVGLLVGVLGDTTHRQAALEPPPSG
jgi:MFS family permease